VTGLGRFHFGNGAECQLFTRTFLLIFVFLRLFVVQLWTNIHQTDDNDIITLTLDIIAHVTDATPSSTKFEVRRSPIRKTWRFFRLSINWPRDLMITRVMTRVITIGLLAN